MANAQQLFVGTYNIRNHNSDDDREGNVWTTRCRVICDELNFEDPDVFGTQEVLHEQLGDLLNGLDGYDYIGVGRDDGKEAGEYSAISIRKTGWRCSDMVISGSMRHRMYRSLAGMRLVSVSAHGDSSDRRLRDLSSIISIFTWIMLEWWHAVRLPSL